MNLRQQLILITLQSVCNTKVLLEVRVGIEPTNNSFADCDITILSSHYNSGTA